MKLLPIIVILFCSLVFAKDPVRVSIANDQHWQLTGIHPNTEQVKSLNKACPSITITNDASTADFVVVWETKTWAQTSWSGHQNEFTIYTGKGDLVSSGAAHKISNAAHDICSALTKEGKK